jgi:hypothetical protein
MKVKDSFSALVYSIRIASTGYRYGVCAVMGGAVAVVLFMLLMSFFWAFGKIH